MKRQVTVIGAGAVGLFSAWALRRAGCRVQVFERGREPGEASWAGGGILMPLEPGEHTDALNPLIRQSRRAYPELAARLARGTGVDPEYSACGALVLGRACDAVHDWALRAGEPVRRLDPGAVAALESGLQAPEGAVLLPEAAQVRNPRLLKALVAHLIQLGVEFRFNTPVAALDVDEAGRVTVRTHSGRWPADAVVVAAGAWSAPLLAPLGVDLPVTPVKGQMLLLRPARALLRRIVVGDGAYLVPRRDEQILVGSTVEHAGFDKTPTAEAADALKQAAARLVPALAQARLVQHWAGLRPGSADGLPYIGPLPGHARVFVNTGHYRLGLTLAPASAELLADLVLDRTPELDPAPFRPDRRL